MKTKAIQTQERITDIRGDGVSTWKLVLLALVVIGLSVVGGVVFQTHSSHRIRTQVDLGFDFPASHSQPGKAG